MTEIPSRHPYWYVRTLVEERLSEIGHLYLSYYEYAPQSLVDNRKVLRISAKEFINPNHVIDLINDTPSGQELAFHSEISSAAQGQSHVPMVDMSTGSAAQLAKLRPFLGESLFQKFKWYQSGRSFHGYANTLVTSQEWVVLMGTLLLVNRKGLVPTVDPRWIGHRLIAGYAALRWTKNTNHYIDIPREVD